MWLVNSKNRTKPTSANLFGFSSDPESSHKREETPEVESLKNRALVLQFFKSPVTVNPWMTKQTCIYLQGEDRSVGFSVHTTVTTRTLNVKH